MKKSIIRKWLAGLCLGGMALASNASAISFSVNSLNTNNDVDAPSTWFSVGLTLGGNGKATFVLSNLVDSGNATKISSAWLGTTGAANSATDGFFSFFKSDPLDGVASGTGVSYALDYNPNSNVGGVLWGVEVEGDPATGNDASLINPGETLSLTFSLVNALTTEQELINAFYANPQQLGFAFHVQKIGPNGAYSEKYEALPTRNSVPDGGATIALLGLSLLGMTAARQAMRPSKA